MVKANDSGLFKIVHHSRELIIPSLLDIPLYFLKEMPPMQSIQSSYFWEPLRNSHLIEKEVRQQKEES